MPISRARYHAFFIALQCFATAISPWRRYLLPAAKMLGPFSSLARYLVQTILEIATVATYL
jgi:hypothetical protein